jgi:hypothetical protein
MGRNMTDSHIHVNTDSYRNMTALMSLVRRHLTCGVNALPLEEFGEALHRVRTGQGIRWHTRPS